MPVLLIRSERTGSAWRVWPEAEELPAGAVQENGTYLFELQDVESAATAELLIDDRPLEALRAKEGTARWRWALGFHAGTVDAELRIPGQRPLRFAIETDPEVSKLTRGHFDLMLREILEDSFALFAVSSFRRGVARGPGRRPPPIARLEFLRSRIELVDDIVRAIARRPRHMLRAEAAEVPYHCAPRATGTEIVKPFRTGRALMERGSGSRLPPPLRGLIPARLQVQRRRASYDLPEHRQIGACLRAWASWMSSVAGLLDAMDPADDSWSVTVRTAWATRCRRLSRRLARLAGLSPFAEIGDSRPYLNLSALFRNDPRYRSFFQLWRDINLGIASAFGSFLSVPLARTFELYELWCFLRLTRAAVDEYGAKGSELADLFVIDLPGTLTIAAGALTVRLNNGWAFCFQKRYREYWIEPEGRGTFSRDMAPDISLEAAPGDLQDRVIVLDAKYRIDTGLNDALSSIHTYRDALVREGTAGRVTGIVGAAYLLTPHVPELASGYRGTNMPGRLFHPEYRSQFRFGAISLRPGMAKDELRRTLRMIAADVGA